MLDDVALMLRCPPPRRDGNDISGPEGVVWVVDKVCFGIIEELFVMARASISPTHAASRTGGFLFWSELTFLIFPFHFWPPTRTLTVLCIRPAVNTTP